MAALLFLCGVRLFGIADLSEFVRQFVELRQTRNLGRSAAEDFADVSLPTAAPLSNGRKSLADLASDLSQTAFTADAAAHHRVEPMVTPIGILLVAFTTKLVVIFARKSEHIWCSAV